jgi:hypothetical protein
MRNALSQAKEAREFILDRMLEAIPESREQLRDHAPRISTIKINPEFIGMVIGKGGETIRSLEADYDVQIDIEEDGTILIYATEGTNANNAIAEIQSMTKEPEPGQYRRNGALGEERAPQFLPAGSALRNRHAVHEQLDRPGGQTISGDGVIAVEGVDLEPVVRELRLQDLDSRGKTAHLHDI